MRLRSGEVLGVAGVEGNGQSELAEILFGLRQPSSGEVLIKGSRIGRLNPSGCRRCKVAYIPEDRMRIGVAARESILSNMLIDKVDRYLRGPFLKEKEMNRDAEKLLAEFTVLARTVDTPAGMLSGGNIQKVVAAREMTEEAQIIIAEQPTRGIDPGASEIIRRKLLELRDKGAAVLLISADLNEILEMSDGVIVLHEGKINGYFPDTTALTEEELGYYMLGVKKQSRESVEAALCG
jgi:simple sugar transport system ATP-binding protein